MKTPQFIAMGYLTDDGGHVLTVLHDIESLESECSVNMDTYNGAADRRIFVHAYDLPYKYNIVAKTEHNYSCGNTPIVSLEKLHPEWKVELNAPIDPEDD